MVASIELLIGEGAACLGRDGFVAFGAAVAQIATLLCGGIGCPPLPGVLRAFLPSTSNGVDLRFAGSCAERVA